MSDFDPDAYLAKKPGQTDFDPDAYLANSPTGVPGSPLEKALAEQKGDVVTVETPTGPTQFTRQGAPFLGVGEAQQMGAAGGARFKERALEGGLSFLSGGGPLLDEMAGAKGAVFDRRPSEGLLDAYRRVRNSARRDVASATRNASPTVSVADMSIPVLPLAGAVAPSLLAPNPATWLGRMGLSGAVGAEQAVGESRSDLTRGDVGGFLKDTGRGAGTGLAAAGVVEGLGVPIRAIARGAASRIGDVAATQAAKDAAAVADDVASLKSEFGRASTAVNRAGENTRGIIGGVPSPGASAIDPALQSRALLQLSDPNFVSAQQHTLENVLDDFPATVARRDAAETAYRAAVANQGADAAKRTADFFAKPTITTDVLPRVGRQLQNAATGTAASIPAAIAGGLGYGKMGALAMLASGASMGLSKGALSAARTTAANPRLQAGALEALIQSAQAGQRGLQAGAKATAATSPKLSEDDEASIQAFLSSP